MKKHILNIKTNSKDRTLEFEDKEFTFMLCNKINYHKPEKYILTLPISNDKTIVQMSIKDYELFIKFKRKETIKKRLGIFYYYYKLKRYMRRNK